MSKVLVNETSLNGIASAIREKNGETTKYKPSEMAAAITALVIGGGGGSGDDSGVPNPLIYTGNCDSAFLNGINSWILKNFFDRVQFKDVSKMDNAFYSLKDIDVLPGVEAKNSASWEATYSYSDVKEIGDINNISFSNVGSMFKNCAYLRHCPNFTGTITSNLTASSGGRSDNIFYACSSLRTVPSNFLKSLNTPATSNTYHTYKNMFSQCYVLDEIVGLVATNKATLTSNYFSSTFYNCHRLKRLTFDTKEDGRPYVVSWKNQTIELYKGVGWLLNSDSYITDYNSGITIDKKVVDGETYQALKNDPDWYTGNVYYSRYNHTSAVETINSLPDASAYLATQSGGTNTIKFRQDAGNDTDGGQIGNLTEEEVAVATAKGWAVVYAV